MSKLPYTHYNEELNNKVSELMNEFNHLVNKAKVYGLDIKLHPDSSDSLVLYFNDDYPDTLLVDKSESSKRK